MNFIQAVQVLTDGGVEFVIIGGWAAIIHGCSYVTNDLDICYSRSRENLKRLTAALAPYRPRPRDFPPNLPFIWDEKSLANATTLTLVTGLGAVDLWGEVTGVGSYAEVKSHSILVEAFDREVWTLDLSTLIAAKRAAGRPKDYRLLPELESLLESSDG